MILFDAVGQEINQEDIVIDSRGKFYLVEETEDSFKLQGFLRVRELRFSRNALVKSDNHQYLQAQFSVRVEEKGVPQDQTKRKAIYQGVINSKNEIRTEELKLSRGSHERYYPDKE